MPKPPLGTCGTGLAAPFLRRAGRLCEVAHEGAEDVEEALHFLCVSRRYLVRRVDGIYASPLSWSLESFLDLSLAFQLSAWMVG